MLARLRSDLVSQPKAVYVGRAVLQKIAGVLGADVARLTVRRPTEHLLVPHRAAD
jgi:hypothetical protein